MPATVDLDQFRTFLAIVETGSFTRAAEVVRKTQSAVSMQMRRLEDRVGQAIFARDNHDARLTEEGQRLIRHARRLVRLSDETLAAFDETNTQNVVRVGITDDYADNFLPGVLARFRWSNPAVEVSIACGTSESLREKSWRGDLDLALVTNCAEGTAEVALREPLHWVGPAAPGPERLEILPLALSGPACVWRIAALAALEAAGRKYRVVYTSTNAAAIWATVLSGLAVTVAPHLALRPGARVLTERDGFPPLPICEIGLMRSWHRPSSPIVDKLAEHIVLSLENHSTPTVAG
jgi:DNA-binding transcriptional LysR family regulator